MLIVLALVLVAASALVFTGRQLPLRRLEGRDALPAVRRGTEAPREQTRAFLTVDYKNMDPLIEKVLAGATGTFKEQYERREANLKATAQQGRSVATGKVREVGIGDIDGDTAIVFVAADGSVTNKNTEGQGRSRATTGSS